MCSAKRHVRSVQEADIVCDKVRIMKPVNIASVRAHGVRQLLVYCNGSVKAIGLARRTARDLASGPP